VKDFRGQSRLDERRVSVQQTALRGSLEVLEQAHSAGQWVPDRTVVTFGVWQLRYVRCAAVS
jgi:hypothetical protein